MREIVRIRDELDLERSGREMYALARRLYPICRSITGNGFRSTLDILEDTLPLRRFEVPSGTRVFDWTVPKEWNIRSAWVKGPNGETVVDFAEHSLHILNYSIPFEGRVDRDVLLDHLHSLPEHPDWIPYRTSYYEENWGFCVADAVKASLEAGEYEVQIDTTLKNGSLSYAEHVVEGKTDDEVLISCHGCHPSLANDNVSGLVVIAQLGRLLGSIGTRYKYRFLIVPGTIGAITWLALNEVGIEHIKHGLVLTCLGDTGSLTYKRSRRGDAVIDRAVTHVLASARDDHDVIDFDPYGYDERQYCSPGINLPVGRLTRTPHGMFPEYHTSADNLDFITARSLVDSLDATLEVFEILEGDGVYVNTNPKCEPQLGRRGIYREIGGVPDPGQLSRAMLWVLNMSDGGQTLLDIARASGMRFRKIREAADVLVERRLLRSDSEIQPNCRQE